MIVSSAGATRLDTFPEHQVIAEYEGQYIYRIGEMLYQLIIFSEGMYGLDLFFWNSSEQAWWISPHIPSTARFMELFPDQLMEAAL